MVRAQTGTELHLRAEVAHDDGPQVAARRLHVLCAASGKASGPGQHDWRRRFNIASSLGQARKPCRSCQPNEKLQRRRPCIGLSVGRVAASLHNAGRGNDLGSAAHQS